MSPCRTRPSTSPTGTSPSTSAPRSSPATTSRLPSRPPSVATSTSRRVCERGSTRSSCGSGPARAGRSVSPGVLLGKWVNSSFNRVDSFEVYRSRTGKFVLHVERGPDYTMVDAQGKPAGWRGYLGIGNISYGNSPGESTLEVVADARGASRADPAPALRHGRRLGAAGPRGGPRHLTVGPASPTCEEVRRDRPSIRRIAIQRDRPAQVLRQAARPRRHRPRCRGRDRLRPPWPERRGQDDHGPDPLDPHPRRRRRGPHRRP